MTKPIEEMTPEELEAYEETLNKELKIRDLKEKQAKLEQSKQEEAQKAKEAEMEKLKEEALNAIYEEHPELKPKDKLQDGGETKTHKNDSPLAQYYNGYFDRNKTGQSDSGIQHDLVKDGPKDQFQICNGGSAGVCGFDKIFENTDSDTGCEDDVSAWSPADVYSKIVWNSFVCKADLFDLTVKGIAINPGDGLSVQIRAYGAFGEPSEMNACECGSCASISFSTYTLTLKQYNMEAIICDKDIWDVGSILMDSYINSMSDSWSAWFDKQIYDELETATPGTTETLSNAMSCTAAIAGSCCSDSAVVDLYNAILNVKSSMKEGTNPYRPDYLILSPSVANILKRLQTPTQTFNAGDVKFNSDGDLISVAGLKVVEYCRANSCTDTSSEVMAIIIDSRRAVGAVFGQRPKMYKFFQTNCNSYRIDWWAYFAVGELDTNAIAHIVNP